MTFGRKNAEVAEGVSIVSDSLLITSIAFCLYASTCPVPPSCSEHRSCSTLRLAMIFTFDFLVVPSATGNTFFWRRKSLRRKDDTDLYDDPYGPTILGAVLLFALAAIFTSGLVKLFTNDFVVAQVAAGR